MSGWNLSEEEARENGDFIDELRFGGDCRSDDEIKERVYRSFDDDHPRDWEE